MVCTLWATYLNVWLKTCLYTWFSLIRCALSLLLEFGGICVRCVISRQLYCSSALLSFSSNCWQLLHVSLLLASLLLALWLLSMLSTNFVSLKGKAPRSNLPAEEFSVSFIKPSTNESPNCWVDGSDAAKDKLTKRDESVTYLYQKKHCYTPLWIDNNKANKAQIKDN